ncbi:MAG: glycosyltransferase [Isosphaeraceae bacterium]
MNTRNESHDLISSRRRVRVAHVVESLNLGGLEKLLVEFARHADRVRFDLRFVTLGRRGYLADEIEYLGWPVHALDLPGGRRPRAIFRLARLFHREAVNVVHTHSEGPLLYATPAAWLAGARRVIHTRHHGPDLGNSKHALAAMALVSRGVDRMVCVADDGARCALAEGVAASKLVTLRNGVDLARFPCNGPAADGPALIVARLSPEKDHATLLGAVAIAKEKDPSFRLEIAGGGPCLIEVKALATTLGLNECVRFLGVVHNTPALLERAGQLVLASWFEGISLTLLEGMASGLPVVATRVGGNPEVVVDGETGLLVPPRSPEDLAAALLTIRRDPRLAWRMGQAGRERAEQLFDIRKVVKQYESFYMKSANKEPGQARRMVSAVGAGEDCAS